MSRSEGNSYRGAQGEKSVGSDQHRFTRDRSLRLEFLSGVKAMLPALIGVVPLAVLCGMAAMNAGLSAAMTIGTSVLIFSGAAQLAAVELIGKEAPALLIIVTVVVINLRFLMYSAALAPHFERLSMWWKWLTGYLLSDHAYSISIVSFDQNNRSSEEGQLLRQSRKLWYFLGAALTLWGVWLIGTVVGVVAGPLIPASWSLDFALPLTFIALAMPTIRDRASFGAAISAASIAVLIAYLPFGLGTLIAAAVGIGIGVIIEKRLR